MFYNIYIQSYALYKGLFRWLNWPGYISSAVLQPFAHVIMFSLLGRFASDPGAATFYALGITVFSMSFILTAGLTQSYNYERNYGTIAFLYVTPASRLVNYISRSLLHFPNGLLAAAFGLLAGWLIVGIDFSAVNWGGFILAIMVISFSLVTLGQLLGVASIASRNWIAVQGVASGIILMLTGMVIPVTVFPDIVAEIARLLPVTNGLMALRETFAGAGLGAVSGELIREAATGLVYYAIAFGGFCFFERFVKRAGTLDRDAL